MLDGILILCHLLTDWTKLGFEMPDESQPGRVSLREVPFLSPKRTMDPAEPCWCGSGKNWGGCHANRSRDRRPNIHALLPKMVQKFARGYCSHPNAPTGCGPTIIRSHTVQRNVSLSAIAEKGHVISPKAGAANVARNHGTIVPTSIGINDASTFLGFCNVHDAELFRSVETGRVQLDRETAFLLSLRAIAMERYLKFNALKVNGFIQGEVDKGLPFERQAVLQEQVNAQLHGLKLGLDDTDREKKRYDAAYADPGRGAFGYYLCRFKDILPFVASGGFAPLTDLFGNPLQELAAPAPIDILLFNLTVLGTESVLLFGWMTPEGPAEAFARSYEKIRSAEKANAALLIALRAIENTYLRPSWWDGQGEINRYDMTQAAHAMTEAKFAFHMRDGKRQDGSMFVLNDVIEEKSSWSIPTAADLVLPATET